MKKFFMAVIAMMMTVSVSAQFYIYLSNGNYLVADSISVVAPSNEPVAPNFQPAVFSVSATEKVYFSQGNLLATYNGSSWTWSFAEHQYDYMGSAAANTTIDGNGTVSANGTVDLFEWSTAATYFGIHNSKDNSTYSGEFVDWGTNAISNGGNAANLWRTLTYDEWNYLFNTRTNANNLRSQATVDGVHGYILLPDDFVLSAGFTFNANSQDWLLNNYSAMGWSKLEALGAVFLPAAGGRYGTDVGSVGSLGYYWSATPIGTEYAYYMGFNSNEVGIDSSSRNYGLSVRLVRNAE